MSGSQDPLGSRAPCIAGSYKPPRNVIHEAQSALPFLFPPSLFPTAHAMWPESTASAAAHTRSTGHAAPSQGGSYEHRAENQENEAEPRPEVSTEGTAYSTGWIAHR